MGTEIQTRGGRRFWTRSRFVLGVLLAVAVIFGMLAMHSLHLQGSMGQPSSTADILTSQPPSPVQAQPHAQGRVSATVTVAVDDGHGVSSGMSCANCSPGELSMAVNCLIAVVLGLLLLLPRKFRTALALPLLRAGPLLRIPGLTLTRAPSLQVLCINRC